MKKQVCIFMITIYCFLLCACSNIKHVEESEKWNCSVICAEESDNDSYVITYSNEKIISNTGTLSFQNQNDFDIAIHLLNNGEEERTSEIRAGGVAVLYQIKEDVEYTVGCHADVPEGTEIQLFVYDGDEVEVFTSE